MDRDCAYPLLFGHRGRLVDQRREDLRFVKAGLPECLGHGMIVAGPARQPPEARYRHARANRRWADGEAVHRVNNGQIGKGAQRVKDWLDPVCVWWPELHGSLQSRRVVRGR